MAEPGDQQWLDALAGRAASGAGADEARAVRAAILATHDESEAASHDIEAGAQQLLFRLRREGLASGKRPSRPHWHMWSAFAIAATLALGIGISVMRPAVDDAPVYRGARPQAVQAADPAALASTLTQELEALGIKARVTRFGDVHTLNADWPAQPSADHKAFLQRHGLKQPAGALAVELSKP